MILLHKYDWRCYIETKFSSQWKRPEFSPPRRLRLLRPSRPKHEPEMMRIEEQRETVFGASPKGLSPGFAMEFQQGLLRSFEQFDMKRSQSRKAAGDRSPLPSGNTETKIILYT